MGNEWRQDLSFIESVVFLCFFLCYGLGCIFPLESLSFLHFQVYKQKFFDAHQIQYSNSLSTWLQVVGRGRSDLSFPLHSSQRQWNLKAEVSSFINFCVFLSFI